MLNQAIAMAQQKMLINSGNLIDLFAQSYKEINPNGKLAPLFSNTNRNKLTYDASDAAVISYLHDEASAAMRQTYQVLNHRINQFGVAQPSISLDENRAIISVELAGATDPDRVRNYLQSTANLQFWEVYTLGDQDQVFVADFGKANKALQDYLNGTKTDSATTDTDRQSQKGQLYDGGKSECTFQRSPPDSRPPHGPADRFFGHRRIPHQGYGQG